MKLAILGGSFNPVHLGHLFVAGLALQDAYDRVILVPAFKSPFKTKAEGASPSERLAMLSASIEGDPKLGIDNCEIRRAGVSYTIDTIDDIIKRYGLKQKPGLILGDDLADTFHLWHKAHLIAEKADIIVARRLNQPDKDIPFPYPHRKLENNIMDISSALIREKIKKGENWQYLVPQGARNIIENQNLYGYKTNGINTSNPTYGENIHETMALLEKIARLSLSPMRFLHSRQTALMAFDLCLYFGLDPWEGYLAGIAHDLCKTMNDKELLLLAESNDYEIQQAEKEVPSLLHGLAASHKLKTQYNIKDEKILEAVRHHVIGPNEAAAKDVDLAKIIYIADKIEVSRHWVDPKLREKEAFSGLDEMYNAVLNYQYENS